VVVLIVVQQYKRKMLNIQFGYTCASTRTNDGSQFGVSAVCVYLHLNLGERRLAARHTDEGAG
jgi:hypothetical protein